MPRISKSKQRAIKFVNDLVDVLSQMNSMTRREAAATARLLRAGCAFTINGGELPEWEDAVHFYPGLDTGEALLHLSNELVSYDDKFSLNDICNKFES